MTFEQCFGGVDGDNALLEELVSILLDFAEMFISQDLAIKWSVNLHCFAKAIDSGHHKIDGFLRACEDAGALDGGAGVVVQVANENNLVLTGEMADEKFAVYNKETNGDPPLEMFAGLPPGTSDGNGESGEDTIFAKGTAKLQRHENNLMERDSEY